MRKSEAGFGPLHGSLQPLLTRTVRVIRCQLEETWLGKTKKLMQFQRADHRWREMINYLEGGRLARARSSRNTIDQFHVENYILYPTKRNLDNSIRYKNIRTKESARGQSAYTRQFLYT